MRPVTSKVPGYADLMRWAPQDGAVHHVVLCYWRRKLMLAGVDGRVVKRPPRVLGAVIEMLHLQTITVSAHVVSSAMSGFPGVVAQGGEWAGYA